MDSGNSGSISSSGDEEYDSRTESIPSFLNPSSDSNPSDPSHLLSHHHLFDLSPSNYLQPNSSSNPSFLLNLDTSTALRSRSDLRSDHPHHHHHHQTYQLGQPSLSSSSSAHQYAAAGSSAIHVQQPDQTTLSGHTLRSGTTASAPAPTTTSSSSGQTTVVRNSKKRTRASRRAPTTVLTTDTSNFRAMVQEFTGIPAPPFSGSSFSRRLDLFGSGSSLIRSGAGAGHLEGPLYPFRPSAQKPQTSPFGHIASSSSSSSPLFSNVMVDATNMATSSLNFQPSPSDHHRQGLMSKQPRNYMLNMQNPAGINMGFQSLPLHPNSLNMVGFGAKQGQGSNLAMCTTTSALDHQDQLNASYHRGIDSNQVASDGTTVVPLTRQDIWRVDGTAGSGDSCKLNYAAAAAANSSEFQVEKGLEINVSTRNEGTVDPWIFPSD